MSGILAAVSCVLLVAIAAVVAKKYARTRDLGLLILTFVLLGWGPLMAFVNSVERPILENWSSEPRTEVFPYSAFTSSWTAGDVYLLSTSLRNALRLFLILVGVSLIYRIRARSPSST